MTLFVEALDCYGLNKPLEVNEDVAAANSYNDSNKATTDSLSSSSSVPNKTRKTTSRKRPANVLRKD